MTPVQTAAPRAASATAAMTPAITFQGSRLAVQPDDLPQLRLDAGVRPEVHGRYTKVSTTSRSVALC
jgi:hypothetical protein